MSATVPVTGITHEVSGHVDFHFYAYTACMIRVEWMETNGNLVSLDPDDVGPRNDLAIRTDGEVDCMACVAARPREDDEP